MRWIALLAVAACGPSAVQREALEANAAALAANAVLAPLLADYRDEGLSAIDSAGTRLEAQASLIRVESRWRLVWGLCDDEAAGPIHHCHDGAWPAIVAAQDAWATLLERQAQGQPVDAATVHRVATDLRDAFCDLRAAIPSGAAIPAAVSEGCTHAP